MIYIFLTLITIATITLCCHACKYASYTGKNEEIIVVTTTPLILCPYALCFYIFLEMFDYVETQPNTLKAFYVFAILLVNIATLFFSGLSLLVVLLSFCDIIGNYKITKYHSVYLDYKTFSKMYHLHPENFEINDTSMFYHNKRFWLSFFYYIKVHLMILSEDKKKQKVDKSKKDLDAKNALYSIMRDDLNNDLAAIEKQKTDAYDKIKTSTDNINEIANRLIKEAH